MSDSEDEVLLTGKKLRTIARNSRNIGDVTVPHGISRNLSDSHIRVSRKNVSDEEDEEIVVKRNPTRSRRIIESESEEEKEEIIDDEDDESEEEKEVVVTRRKPKKTILSDDEVEDVEESLDERDDEVGDEESDYTSDDGFVVRDTVKKSKSLNKIGKLKSGEFVRIISKESKGYKCQFVIPLSTIKIDSVRFPDQYANIADSKTFVEKNVTETRMKFNPNMQWFAKQKLLVETNDEARAKNINDSVKHLRDFSEFNYENLRHRTNDKLFISRILQMYWIDLMNTMNAKQVEIALKNKYKTEKVFMDRYVFEMIVGYDHDVYDVFECQDYVSGKCLYCNRKRELTYQFTTKICKKNEIGCYCAEKIAVICRVIRHLQKIYELRTPVFIPDRFVKLAYDKIWTPTVYTGPKSGFQVNFKYLDSTFKIHYNGQKTRNYGFDPDELDTNPATHPDYEFDEYGIPRRKDFEPMNFSKLWLK
jgi:hypothetical protein